MQKKFLCPVIIMILLQACSTPVTTQQAVVTEPASIKVTQTKKPTALPLPSATPQVPTPNPIKHEDIPTQGIGDRVIAHDHDSAESYEKKSVRGGDEFFRNQLERPFTSAEMNYLPDVDIVNFSIMNDPIFYYVRISLVGMDVKTKSLTGSYAVEIDYNRDGRAELLLTASGPYSEEFTADNVAVYMDINNDVGGSKINRPDDVIGDGFETTIYDLGQNVYPDSDPDFAWVRQTTDGSLPAIEIAFKKWIFLEEQEYFMWSVDASGSPINPAVFYVNDLMTAEEAGAAKTDDPNYPVKAFAAFDNSCRMPFGFTALGTETLGCFKKSGDPEKSIRTNDDKNSTCGQFAELCERTEKSRIPFVE